MSGVTCLTSVAEKVVLPHRQEDVERNLSTSVSVKKYGVYDLSPFTSEENEGTKMEQRREIFNHIPYIIPYFFPLL